MNDPKPTISTLDDLRSIALKNGNEQVATLCLAAKAMYIKLEVAETRSGELLTTMMQLSSLLHVPNKRKVNKNDLLTLLENARDMIGAILATEVEHA